MLGARIDVIQPQMRNLILFLLPLSDKNRRQLWLNTIKRADWTETIIKHDRVVIMWSWSLCMCVKQQTVDLYETDLVSSVKDNLSDMFPCWCCSAMVRCCLGVWQKDGGQCSGWWLSTSDITFLQKSQWLMKKHSYFMQVCALYCGLTVLKRIR